MTCDHCSSAEAIVHIQELDGTTKRSLHLCGACAVELGFLDTDVPGAYLVSGLCKLETNVVTEALAPNPAGETDETDLTCPHCGTTSQDLRTIGRLGCAECYTVYAAILAPSLPSLHRGNRHSGRTPRSSGRDEAASAGRTSVAVLKRELNRAVVSEAYEKAAELRDELRLLGALPREQSAG